MLSISADILSIILMRGVRLRVCMRTAFLGKMGDMEKKPTIADIKGKKALVMGLGLHGGGVATAKWLAKRGALVTATDLRNKETLSSSIASLQKLPITYILSEHREEDFRTNDLIVVNPGVPRESKYLKIAKKAGKRIENDASLFFASNTHPVIAVTGTRGKTTTTLWIAELLKKRYFDTTPSGNTPENAFLKEYDRLTKADSATPVVAEMSSWQLEFLPVSKRAPHIAIITNLYRDHLNRYGGKITSYASAKANIFKDQHEDDFLILDHDNEWTKFFLEKHPKSTVFFTSVKSLPKGKNGLFVRKDHLVFRFDGIEQQLFPIKRFASLRGAHNLKNLLHAVLAVKLFDPSIPVTERMALALPSPRMRQEIVATKGRLTVVNDSCATSPDGTVAAIKRFAAGSNPVLIVGGTDKMLDFDELATTIKKHIPSEQLVLLDGSATKKLLAALVAKKYFRGYAAELHNSLESCVKEAFRIASSLSGKKTILFSPGAASFEKFLHEFDRGEQWNKLAKRFLK